MDGTFLEEVRVFLSHLDLDLHRPAIDDLEQHVPALDAEAAILAEPRRDNAARDGAPDAADLRAVLEEALLGHQLVSRGSEALARLEPRLARARESAQLRVHAGDARRGHLQRIFEVGAVEREHHAVLGDPLSFAGEDVGDHAVHRAADPDALSRNEKTFSLRRQRPWNQNRAQQ
jgi:hypothetical protein